MDNRPCYRVAAVGLEAREVKLIEIVFRHSTHNPFAYQLASPDERDLAELAIVDPSRPEGAHYVDRSTAVLGPDGHSKPMVSVVAPSLTAQFPGAVALDRLTLQLLPILNRLVREQITLEAAAGIVSPELNVSASQQATPALAAATPAASVASPAVASPAVANTPEHLAAGAGTVLEPAAERATLVTTAKTGVTVGAVDAATTALPTAPPDAKQAASELTPARSTVAASTPASTAAPVNSPMPTSPPEATTDKPRNSVWGRVFGDSATPAVPVAAAGQDAAASASTSAQAAAAGRQADKPLPSPMPVSASATARPSTPAASGASAAIPVSGSTGASAVAGVMPAGASGAQQAVRLGEHAAVAAARQTPAATSAAGSVPGANVLPLPAASVVRALPQGPLHAVPGGAQANHPSTPASANSGPASAASATVPAEPTFKLRILVVDDSPTVQRQLMRTLNSMGLVCDLAGDGATAMLALQHEHYDVVLVDLMLPDTDGVQLTRRIRKDKRLRGIPIIVLTGRTSPLDHARAALAGATMYLSKPISLKTLESALVKVLRRTLAIDELRLYMKPLGSQAASGSVASQSGSATVPAAQTTSSSAFGASGPHGPHGGPHGPNSPQGPESSASRTGG